MPAMPGSGASAGSRRAIARRRRRSCPRGAGRRTSSRGRAKRPGASKRRSKRVTRSGNASRLKRCSGTQNAWITSRERSRTSIVSSAGSTSVGGRSGAELVETRVPGVGERPAPLVAGDVDDEAGGVQRVVVALRRVGLRQQQHDDARRARRRRRASTTRLLEAADALGARGSAARARPPTSTTSTTAAPAMGA